MRSLVFLAALTLAACNSEPAKPGITDAVVTLPAVSGYPGAAYFTLHGGPTEMRLMDVTSADIGHVELHDMTMKGGMMDMARIESGVAIPVSGEVKFASGSKHAMLFDMNPKLKAGQKIQLTFIYADGLKMTADAAIRAPGDAGSSH